MQTELRIPSPKPIDYHHQVLSIPANGISILPFAYISSLKVSFSYSLYPMSGNFGSTFKIYPECNLFSMPPLFLIPILSSTISGLDIVKDSGFLPSLPSIPHLCSCDAHSIQLNLYFYVFFGRMFGQVLREVC